MVGHQQHRQGIGVVGLQPQQLAHSRVYAIPGTFSDERLNLARSTGQGEGGFFYFPRRPIGEDFCPRFGNAFKGERAREEKESVVGMPIRRPVANHIGGGDGFDIRWQNAFSIGMTKGEHFSPQDAFRDGARDVVARVPPVNPCGLNIFPEGGIG